MSAGSVCPNPWEKLAASRSTKLVAVAVVFFSLGADKFAAQSMWIRVFDQIGFGNWFRYFTGALQIAGAALVLIPRTFLFGILLLASTMFGAAVIRTFMLHAPGNAPIPALLLVALLVVGARGLGTRA